MERTINNIDLTAAFKKDELVKQKQVFRMRENQGNFSKKKGFSGLLKAVELQVNNKLTWGCMEGSLFGTEA